MISARIGLPIFIILIAAISEPLEAQERRCQPVDEAARKPDFFTFRARLQSAVARRDAGAVVAALDPNIRLNFGGASGVDDFKQRWRVDEPDSQLWEELGAVLALGGSFNDEGAFVAPYVFSRCDVGAFEEVAVIGAGVRVRETASPAAPILATLSFAIVGRASPREEGAAWAPIKLDDGRRGFVAARLVRASTDYRAYFTRKDGIWRMTLFLSGD